MGNNQNNNVKNISPGIKAAIFAALIGSILFSGKGILAKAGMAHGASSFEILALRMAFAAPIYGAVLLWTFHRNNIPLRLYFQAAGLGLLGFYISPTLNFYGLASVSASLERVLIYMCPALIILIASCKGREKLTRFTMIALAICYAGVALSCLGRDGNNANADPRGVIAILVGCVSWSFFVVESAHLQQKTGSLVFTSVAMLSSAVACGIQNVFSGHLQEILHPPSGVLPIAIALALLCTAVPAYLTAYSLRKLGPGRSAALSMFGPLLTPILAAVILGEQMSAAQIGGFALVFSGGILLSRRTPET